MDEKQQRQQDKSAQNIAKVLIAKQWQMKEVIQLQSKAILKQYRAHTQAKTLVKTSTKNT